MKIQVSKQNALGIIISVCEALMLWPWVRMLSLELLPEWHKWSQRLTLALLAGFFALSVFIFFFCCLKRKLPWLFELWAFVCLFFGNTLKTSPAWLQIVLAAVLMIYMMHEGLFAGSSSAALVVVVFAICLMLSYLLIPAIGRIEKPQIITDLENDWLDLFYNPVSSGGSGSLPQDAPESQSESSVPDNMITNDPFPGEDDSPVCDIRSSYPLPMLHVFSCGDYDPESFTFSIWGDDAALPGAHSPSSAYYDKALGDASDLPQRAMIKDLRKYRSMMLMPYCSFRADPEGLKGYGDRFIQRNASHGELSLNVSFDPELRYSSGARGYDAMAGDDYLGIPEEFKEDLLRFCTGLGLDPESSDIKEKLNAVEGLLERDYVLSTTPPELPEGEDPVMWFLLEGRTGSSKHFAAARVFLYRTLGIPARYSFGYGIREYTDGEAQVSRADATAFCELYVKGCWMLPEEALLTEDEGTVRISETSAPEQSSSDAIFLPNGYDISRLRGTPSMFGPYDGPRSFNISRTSRKTDDTVVLVVDTELESNYIKAFSMGDYSYPEGSFSILSDTEPEPELEEGKSLSQYASEAFLSPEGNAASESLRSFRIFNLYAPKYVYTPACPLERDGLSGGDAAAFSMKADRMMVPDSSNFSWEDITLFEGEEPSGAGVGYENYARSKYTDLPGELDFELRRFLKEKGIDPESRDKAALMEDIRSLLEGYVYSIRIDSIPAGKDPVLWFLTESRRGYCQHFASAGVLLLRACGIPARLVSGYVKDIPAGSITEITAEDAHSWGEVFDGKTWQRVEFCVGTAAEGEKLPAGIDAGADSSIFPQEELPPEVTDVVSPQLLFVLTAMGALAIAFAATILLKKNWPSAMQRAEIQYRYIQRYYFVDEETEGILNKISYSREGAGPEDIEALERTVSKARKLLRYRHKYPELILSMLAYFLWNIKAAAGNILSGKGSDPA